MLCVQVAQSLVNGHANPLICDASGTSALSQAIATNSAAEMVLEMLRHCKVADLAQQDKCVVLAVSCGNVSTMEQLIVCRAKAGNNSNLYCGWPLEWLWLAAP